MPANYKLQSAASQFRSANGIGPTDPIRLQSWLLKLGVMAMFKPLSDRFSGMAVRYEKHKFMLINASHRISKQHFTVAHELYHLFIQKEFVSEISNAGRFDRKDANEYDADCFAAYLLMPEEGILSLIPPSELSKNKISLPTIVKLEQYFACSRSSLLFRLNEIGLIDRSKYERHLQNVKLSALMLGYDAELYEPGNSGLVIGDYGVKAKKLYDLEHISESHFFNLMSDIGIDISAIDTGNERE